MHVWSQARKAIDRLFDAFDRDASHDLSTRELGKALHDELGLAAKAEDTIALLQARHVDGCCCSLHVARDYDCARASGDVVCDGQAVVVARGQPHSCPAYVALILSVTAAEVR